MYTLANTKVVSKAKTFSSVSLLLLSGDCAPPWPENISKDAFSLVFWGFTLKRVYSHDFRFFYFFFPFQSQSKLQTADIWKGDSESEIAADLKTLNKAYVACPYGKEPRWHSPWNLMYLQIHLVFMLLSFTVWYKPPVLYWKNVSFDSFFSEVIPHCLNGNESALTLYSAFSSTILSPQSTLRFFSFTHLHINTNRGCCHARFCPTHWKQFIDKCLAQGHISAPRGDKICQRVSHSFELHGCQ